MRVTVGVTVGVRVVDDDGEAVDVADGVEVTLRVGEIDAVAVSEGIRVRVGVGGGVSVEVIVALGV